MPARISDYTKSEALPVQVSNPNGKSPVILVCEHASNHIPDEFENLGLDADARDSHVAWDPGALAVARSLSSSLDAVLVAGRVSRLVFDCNRAPDATDAMPAHSEVFEIPGNAGLSRREKSRRVARYYDPFREVLDDVVSGHDLPAVLVTVHSFTPVYLGKPRAVELGILHDSDSRIADQMLRVASSHTDLNVLRNQPYGPGDGVTHTLKVHGIGNGLPNVMLEIRNDLIGAQDQQRRVAAEISGLLSAAMAALGPVTQKTATG